MFWTNLKDITMLSASAHVSLVLMVSVWSVYGSDSRCPAAPPDFVQYAQHCIGSCATGKTCAQAFKTSDCSNEGGVAGCFASASSACINTSSCNSFSIFAGGANCVVEGPMSYHLYSAAAGYPIQNEQWLAYSKTPAPPQPCPPAPPPAPPSPTSVNAVVQAMRCGVRQLAVEATAARVGATFGPRVTASVMDALRMQADCPNVSTVTTTFNSNARGLQRQQTKQSPNHGARASRMAPHVDDTDTKTDTTTNTHTNTNTTPTTPTATTPLTVYISPSGSDSSGDGSSTKPFLSPTRARDAIRTVRVAKGWTTESAAGGAVGGGGGTAVVVVGGGVYHLGDLGALELDARDSHTQWQTPSSHSSSGSGGGLQSNGSGSGSSGGGVFSGTSKFSSLDWKRHSGNIVVAQIAQGLNVSALFDVGGSMLIRARTPNGNPTQLSGQCIMGGTLASEKCNGYMEASGEAPSTAFVGTTEKTITFETTRGGNVAGDDVYRTYDVLFQSPPENLKEQGYPTAVCNQGEGGGELYNRSGSLVWKTSDQHTEVLNTSSTWVRPGEAVVHMMHNGWGNVMYSVKSFHAKNHTILFERGGFQHGRSGSVSNFYVENQIELLDSAGEWYYDTRAGLLYLWPNVTSTSASSTSASASAPADLFGSVLETVVHVKGNSSAPVVNVSFNGVTFTQTATAFLKPYERPISGDWAIRRSGTVIVEGAESISFRSCNFTNTGGNALLFSLHVKRSLVEDSEFVFVGDSAVVAFGNINWTSGDARFGDYPSELTIRRNFVHEIGVWGKQVSAFFQGVSGNNQFTDNVAFNGPRAMVNINDGMLGLSNISGNVLFNGCRESDDHGNFNSWDRTPMLHLTNDTTGTPSWTPGRSTVSRNLLINSYGAGHGIDHDDGSMEWDDIENVIGHSHACKGNYGSNRNCSANIVLAPGLTSSYGTRAGGGRPCVEQTNNGHGSTFAKKYFQYNRCVYIANASASPYIFQSCKENGTTIDNVWGTRGNTYYVPTPYTVNVKCGGHTMPLNQWEQQYKQDVGAVVEPLPPMHVIMDEARTLLRL